MPILDDIMTHDVLGPTFRQGRKEGLQRGLEKGLEKGRQEGELNLLRLQINKRFGALPARLEKRLAKLSLAELEAVSLRLFDAKSINELFAR
jgi:flagellar biosynthesis/type III secretory pathway protein FliH